MNRLFGLLLFALVALVMASSLFGATGGLNLQFSQYPSSIAPWFEPPVEYSAALEPRTHMRFGAQNPAGIPSRGSSYESSSLTFEKEYYRLGTKKYQLIPVTVDAKSYSSWRREWLFRERFRESLKNNLADPQRSSKHQGLGLSIQLPKRLDKIFGEGGAGLKVSGYRSISFQGTSQWTDDVSSDVQKPSRFPDLNIEQQSRIDIAGNIGSKITVKVSEDTQSDIPLANRIQIRYQGDEDDILKVVEAGNTTLSLPQTQFVGYSQSIRGLFGIKTEAQVGGLRLVGIASQEKGSSEKTSISPTGEENAITLRDYNYADGRIFDLFRPGELQPGDSITKLVIYEQEDVNDKPNRIMANLRVNPDFPDSFRTENQGPIHVIARNASDYKFFSDPKTNQHIVVFTSPQSSSRSCGYWAQAVRNGQEIQFGDVKSSDTISLKLLRVKELIALPSFATWKLMWRNCYQAPTGVSVADMDVKIFKGTPDQERSQDAKENQDENNSGNLNRYLTILGLDLFNSSDDSIPDGKMDPGRREIFWSEMGLIIFPYREPFNTDSTFKTAGGIPVPRLGVKVPTIYNYSSSTEKSQETEYYIQISTKTRASVITLNKPNIIEGSERVIVNGQQLTRGSDYTIEYDFGRINLISDVALDPNATINIDFEYAPFFAVQKKSLLGVRAEYDWSKDFGFGATVLYKTDKAQDRKPRVGQETAKQVIYTVDADWRVKTPFITKAIDALPLIRTDAASGMSISGELAQSRPNPNVDGEAYIDDFEAAVEEISLGTSRLTYQLSSRPHQLGQKFVRSKLIWYTPTDLPNHDEVYNSEAAPGQGLVRVLRLVFRPKTKDTVWTETISGNDTALYPGTITNTDTVSWAGITRYFGSRVDAARVQLFEMRAKVSENLKGRLHFDFGRISEDLDLYGSQDGSSFTEDISGNGTVLDEEDTGLDGKMDATEDIKKRRGGVVDPNGDNWFFEGAGKCPIAGGCSNIPDSQKYDWINGTEGNSIEIGQKGVPDAETLSRDGFQPTNAYFSYVIDFNDTGKFAKSRFIVPGSQSGAGASPWITYQIPIMDSSFLAEIVRPNAGDSVSWAAIRHVRVWYESAQGQKNSDTIDVADWYFVQSNWQDTLSPASLSDKSTKFRVVSVSEEDNTFDPPPGVEPYKDPTSGVVEPQRGLSLQFTDLEYQDTCIAYRNLLSGEKYSGYRRMKMYVKGSFDPADDGKVTFFFRVGRDHNNFYEYQRRVYTGWDERNFVDIDFNELTAFKDAQQKARPKSEWAKLDVVDSTRGFRVKGNPSINQVLYFAAGVMNTQDSLADVSGSVQVDELRVSDVRRDIGTAGRLSIGGNLADLFTYNASIVSKDAYFRGLSAATRGGGGDNLGSGATNTTFSSNVSFQTQKFLPPGWGASLPISITYNKSITTPILRTSSDIVLPDSVRKAEQSISESRTFTISESFNNKGKNLLFNLLLNRYKSSFSYRRSKSRSVNAPYHFGESYDYRGDIDLNWSTPPNLPVTGWLKKVPVLKRTSKTKVYFYPTTWTMAGEYNRSLSISRDADSNLLWSVQKTLTGRMDVAYKLFDNAPFNANFSTTRDLSNFGRPKTFLPGLETRYTQSFNGGYDPKLLTWFTIGTSFKSTYTEDWDRGSKTRRATASRSIGVSGKFDHHILLKSGKGKTAARQAGGASARREREAQRKKGLEAQKSDSTAAGKGKSEKEKKDEKGKPFWEYPLDGLRFATGWIQPITYSFSKQYGSNYPSLLGRPDWRFRYGIDDRPDDELFGKTVVGLSVSRSQSWSADMGTGFTVLKGLAVDVKFKHSQSEDIEKQGSLGRTVTESFPDLGIRITQFKGVPYIESYLNKFIQMFTPRTDYRRERRWTEDLDGGFKLSQTTASIWSPLLSINFKLRRDLSLSGTYNLSTEEEIKNNPDNGSFLQTSTNTRKSIGVSTSYSFSSPGGINIPLFGRLKFRSTVKIDFDAKKNYQKTESSANGIVTDKSDMTFNTNIAYTFSQQVTGGLRGKWSDAHDGTIDRNSHTRELAIWARITF